MGKGNKVAVTCRSEKSSGHLCKKLKLYETKCSYREKEKSGNCRRCWKRD